MNLTFAAQLNKMITAGLGGAVEAPETCVAVGRRVEYTSIGPAPLLTFEANSELPLKALSVNMEPIQEGSGDPSPENVRPISGRQSVTVTRAGKNLFDLSQIPASGTANGIAYTKNGDTISYNGTASYSGYAVLSSFTLPKTGTYHFHLDSTGDGGRFLEGYTNKGADATIVCNDTATIYRVALLNTASGTAYSGTVSKIQVELGSTATAYEAPQIQTVEVQLGQTVYGGTVDVVSGEMTVDRAIIASYNGEPLPGEWISDRDAYAPGVIPTTGAQVCYELATPLTFTLTPEQLSTIIGTNNVWSDADEVSLTYGNIYYTEGY